MKQLQIFLERLKTQNVVNYVSTYKLYGVCLKYLSIKKSWNREQLLKDIKDKWIFNKDEVENEVNSEFYKRGDLQGFSSSI